jgi:hypothetical protein
VKNCNVLGGFMEKFYQYIESSLPNNSSDKILYKFKMKTLEEMTNRANELTSRGLKDENVLSDLIISEHKNIAQDFATYKEEKTLKTKRKRFAIANIIGSVTYIFVLIILFLGISFSTQQWGTTWVIVVDGILLWVSYLLLLGVNRVIDMKKMFHFIARILLAMSVVVLSVAIFIFMMAVLHIPNSWVVVFGGLFAMFLADGLFASLTKQRLAIISWLAYIPAMSAMLYVILGALKILKWSVGWVIIPLSLIVDLIIIIAVIKVNTSYKEEVVDSWQEN